jgi:hypothetical protein
MVINFRIQEGRYISQIYDRFSGPQEEIYSEEGDGSNRCSSLRVPDHASQVHTNTHTNKMYLCAMVRSILVLQCSEIPMLATEKKLVIKTDEHQQQIHTLCGNSRIISSLH